MHIISLFNHKGGVSKTTTTFHIGWKLSEKGYKVLMIDTDSQCNLTGLVLGESSFEDFYINEPDNNIKSAIAPAFEGKPVPIGTIEGIKVKDKLWLVPSHIDISSYDISLGMAHNFSSSMNVLLNLPGAFNSFIEKMVEKYEIDYVLIDLNPSLSEINKNLIMISDYFIVPTAPDYFSQMAVGTLASTLPKWKKWQLTAVEYFKDSTYPFPNRNPKFLGIVMQNYTIRNGEPAKAFQDKINQVFEKVELSLVSALKDSDMLLINEELDTLKEMKHCLAMIPNFQSLAALMQNDGKASTPVYAIEEEKLGTGVVKENYQSKIGEFNNVFEKMIELILGCTKID